MDEVTQQNSALVEENAATAKTLESQSRSMDEHVSKFAVLEAAGGKTGSASHAASARPVGKPAVASPKRPAAQAAKRGGPVGRMQSALATAVKEDSSWEEF
jgi:methyl-accepting chemotaxis protein